MPPFDKRFARAPFPYFGGKSRAADLVWQALGDDLAHYIEPFAGSLAVLLACRHPAKSETVNDISGFICNVWRAIKYDPEGVAQWVDMRVCELTMEAASKWLKGYEGELTERLRADHRWFEAEAAGLWVYLRSSRVAGADRHAGLPLLSTHGQGVNGIRAAARGWLLWLSARLHRVRVTCGDWTRTVGGAALDICGKGSESGQVSGLFLDAPYLTSANVCNGTPDIAADVAEWAHRTAAEKPWVRIVLAGYAGDYHMPGWRIVEWKHKGGMANTGKKREPGHNASKRERLWLSPSCLPAEGERLVDSSGELGRPWYRQRELFT